MPLRKPRPPITGPTDKSDSNSPRSPASRLDGVTSDRQSLRTRRAAARALARKRHTPTLNYRRFWVALLKGDFDSAKGTVLELLKHERAEQIYLRLFVPTLGLSGTMFVLDRITYHDEHRVTWGVLRLMRIVRHHIRRAEPNGLTALATGVGQDSHRIGLRMVCDLLRGTGWNVVFLDTNERGTVRDAIRRYKPDALLLSIGYTSQLSAARRLADEARRAGLTGPVAIGGRAVAEDADALAKAGGDLTASNGLRLARALTDWFKPTKTSPQITPEIIAGREDNRTRPERFIEPKAG